MKPLAVFLMSLVVLCACDRSSQRGLPLPRPSPAVVPAPAPPPAPARAITVGEEVPATYIGANLAFELTPPTTGTLVAQLSWDAWGTDSLLELVIEGLRFRSTGQDFSPIVGRAWVTAGTKHSLVVELVGTGMEVDVPFVLKTWME